jgi:hypothetical protein
MEPARRWPGIVLYPSAPSYIANPKMMVMSYVPYVQQVAPDLGPRSFSPHWTPLNEITWGGGASFNSCGSTPAGTLGTFSFYVR